MIANGWLSASDYYQALARACGVPFHGEIRPHEVAAPAGLRSPRECLARGLLKEHARQGAYVFAPEKLRPNAVEEVLARLAPHRLSLASPGSLRQAVCGHFARKARMEAVDRRAKAKLALWQRLLLGSLPLAFGAALVLDAQSAIRALSLALFFIFLPVIALRVFAAYDLLRRPPSKRAQPRIPDAELPVYTILVPLYREANMLASLVRALAHLDYPGAKIDIKLILEAVDVETIAVARSLDLPGNIEIVVVPDLQPRTKPKALNYALPLARGEYLVIYDAEDRPERDQLRKAIAVFQEGPPTLACLQAKLNLYNASDNSTHEGPQQLCSRSLGDSRPNSHPRLSSERPRTHKSSRVCPFLHDSRWANDMHSTGFAAGGKASGHRDGLGESYRALGPGGPALRIDERRQLAERHHCGASLHRPNPSNGHDLLRK